mgnify:FL=1
MGHTRRTGLQGKGRPKINIVGTINIARVLHNDYGPEFLVKLSNGNIVRPNASNIALIEADIQRTGKIPMLVTVHR